MRVDGGVILTASGSYVDPLDLDPLSVRIEDVAHALSNQCRFSGHVSRFYSVAEHSVRVAGILEAQGEPPTVCLWGLLHDASEAYLVDLPSPLKGTEVLGRAYLAAESRAQEAIAEAFHLSPPWIPVPVKKADLVMLATERRDLMPDVGEWAILDGVEPLPTKIVPASPEDAKTAFLEAFADLMGWRLEEEAAALPVEGHRVAFNLGRSAEKHEAPFVSDETLRALGLEQTKPTKTPLFGRTSEKHDALLPSDLFDADGNYIGGLRVAETKQTNPKDAIGADKLPLHLWPASATAYGALGLLDGALKYGRANWREAGVRATIYLDALERHSKAWGEGEDLDPDSGLPHLAHALACLAIIVDAHTSGKLVDDRQYRGDGYRPLVEALTPHVARLKAKHADKAPRHFTIADM